MSTQAFKDRRAALVTAVNTSGLEVIALSVAAFGYGVRGKSFDYKLDKDAGTLVISTKYNLAQVLNKLIAKTNYRLVANGTAGTFILAKVVRTSQAA